MTPLTMRRFPRHIETGSPWVIRDDHGAAIEGRARYPATVRPPGDRVLKSGHNSRKIGKEVVKGKWRGMPIFTLTLEERATCPRSCQHWLDCYGNKMHWAHRFEHGRALEAQLFAELAVLNRAYPKGFVVRLHVLGDFYSRDYVLWWYAALLLFNGLHIFGYTAWPLDTEIGRTIRQLHRKMPDRFAVRTSNSGEPKWSTISINRPSEAPAGSIICPAQTRKTDCCGTCGLCWTTAKPIAFLVH